MQKLFDDLSRRRFGRVARAKALVNTSKGPYRFDSTFGKVNAVRVDKDITAGRMVVIGENLDAVGIGQAV